jgi:imidazolonepropionase-like amidohydrolase
MKLTLLLLVAPLFAQQRPDLVLQTSVLLDGRGGVQHNVTIQIGEGKILSVGRASLSPARTIDLRGLTVMPGWIDTHVHIGSHFDKSGRLAGDSEPPHQAMLAAAVNAWLTLQGGFTTVQSVGAPLDGELRDAIDAGDLPGPRILTSLYQINEKTGDPEAIRALVRKSVAERADLVKLFATKSIRDGGAQSMTEQQIQAACGEAKAAGKRSLVHAHTSDGARAAVLAGCTAIEHGTMLDDSVLDLMASRGTYFDPNFLVLHNYLDNKPKFLGIGNYTEDGFAHMEKAVPMITDVMRRAVARKLKIVLGTDSVAGAHGRNAEEFIHRVMDGGQKPMDAIVSGTSLAAESLGLKDRIGTIAPGMEADLVATVGNPAEDITSVRRVMFVMKGGKIYKASGTMGR